MFLVYFSTLADLTKNPTKLLGSKLRAPDLILMITWLTFACNVTKHAHTFIVVSEYIMFLNQTVVKHWESSMGCERCFDN